MFLISIIEMIYF